MKIGDAFPATLRPTVTPELITVPLQITYSKSINLNIYTQTNRIDFDNNKIMADYIYSHKLSLQSRCTKCLTSIGSNFLDFDLIRKFIKPVGISRENLIVTDETHMFHIYSSYMSEESVIVMDRINRAVASVRLNAPLLPLSRFRDRQHFINKMKTYLLFT